MMVDLSLVSMKLCLEHIFYAICCRITDNTSWDGEESRTITWVTMAYVLDDQRKPLSQAWVSLSDGGWWTGRGHVLLCLSFCSFNGNIISYTRCWWL